MAEWSVGWSAANVSKGSCPWSTVINLRQFQSLPIIKLGQYKQLFYQPKPSQASPDASDRDPDCFHPLFRPSLAKYETTTVDLFDLHRHFQTLPTSVWANTNHFWINPNPSKTPLTEFQKIQYFDFSWNRSSDFDPPRFNWQLQSRSLRLKPSDTIWINSFEPKDGIIKVERWPNVNWGPDEILSLYRVKAKGSVGWSSANVSK